MITRSSDVEESDFEGFNLEQMNDRADESDINLDAVVNDDQLLVKLKFNSEQHGHKDSEGSD